MELQEKEEKCEKDIGELHRKSIERAKRKTCLFYN